MIAPRPQERAFKTQLDQDRLAAIRGDNFTIPEAANNNNFYAEDENTQAANNNRFFPSGSEDGILAQYPLESPLPGAMDTNAIDPNNFSYLQQQARIAEGVNAPSLLSDDVADLPDPEFSTEDETVTYGESIANLEQQAREADSLDQAQLMGSRFRQKLNQATDRAAEEVQKAVKETMSRLAAKAAGNGTNAVGSVGWDGFISFVLSYLYLMARGVVSILSPETQAPQNWNTFQEGARYNSQKILHALIPPYRPLREPGDFIYFVIAFLAGVFSLCITIAIFITVVQFILLPFFMLGVLKTS